jgi:UPF0755 protein
VRVSSLLVAALLACGLVGCRDAPHGAPVRVVIPRGSSFRAAADSLASKGFVPSGRIFSMYASLGGRDKSLKAGTYLLQRGASWRSLVDALTQGKGIVNSVTIPEGFDLYQIVPALARALEVPEDSVRAAVRDTALRRELDVPTETLEGYLFPDTYSFPSGMTARAAVTEMVRRFERAWKPEWDTRLQQLAMNRNDAMALASIIEKEARLPEERAVISAVYHNRLKKRMLLQADPTVQYAMGRHVARVMYKDLKTESPYNTYVHAGLPPGPIASPGAPSMEAAINPAHVPYLYFVAHPDGHHEFRTTFAEHNRAVGDARRMRAESASSASKAMAAKPNVTRPSSPKPRGAR